MPGHLHVHAKARAPPPGGSRVSRAPGGGGARLPLQHPRVHPVPLQESLVLPLDAEGLLPRPGAAVRLAPVSDRGGVTRQAPRALIMGLSFSARRAVSMPPGELARKASALLVAKARAGARRWRDFLRCSYAKEQDVAGLTLGRFFRPLPAESLRPHLERVACLA